MLYLNEISRLKRQKAVNECKAQQLKYTFPQLHVGYKQINKSIDDLIAYLEIKHREQEIKKCRDLLK